jgi:hypothetical protein
MLEFPLREACRAGWEPHGASMVRMLAGALGSALMRAFRKRLASRTGNAAADKGFQCRFG